MMGTRDAGTDHIAMPEDCTARDEASKGHPMWRLVSDQVSPPVGRLCPRSEADCCFHLHEAVLAFAGNGKRPVLFPWFCSSWPKTLAGVPTRCARP